MKTKSTQLLLFFFCLLVLSSCYKIYEKPSEPSDPSSPSIDLLVKTESEGGHYRVYTYNTDKTLSKVSSYDAANTLIKEHTNVYEMGKLKEFVAYQANGNHTYRWNVSEVDNRIDKVVFVGETFTVTTEYTYNSQGQLTKVKVGGLNCTNDIIYKQGLIDEVLVTYNDMVDTLKFEYNKTLISPGYGIKEVFSFDNPIEGRFLAHSFALPIQKHPFSKISRSGNKPFEISYSYKEVNGKLVRTSSEGGQLTYSIERVK